MPPKSSFDAGAGCRRERDGSSQMSWIPRATGEWLTSPTPVLLSRAGMTRFLEGLERDGLVERQPGECDTREASPA